VTGLHITSFYDEPKVYSCIIGGRGEPEKLAAPSKMSGTRSRKFALITRAAKRSRVTRQRPERSMPPLSETILGQKAETQDGVVKVTIGRDGMMPRRQGWWVNGLTTWPRSPAAMTCSCGWRLIMTAAEVQPVLHALRKANIHIGSAGDNHMIGEQPAFYFTHFWGKGRAGARQSREICTGSPG